jgi:YD repeat-containing protein
MDGAPGRGPELDPRLQNIPITPGHGGSDAWDALARLVWRHLFLLAVAVGISFAIIYFETTTRLFFSLEAPRQRGDPCLTLIRPTTGPDVNAIWSNFGECPSASRDPDRETIAVDLRFGLLMHYKTEPVMTASLPLPFTRVLRHRDNASRAFGTGGSHTYDMALVGDAAKFTWIDLVLADGGRVRYLPMSQPGWFDSEVSGYFGGTTLQWTGRDWRLRRDDGVELQFPESENATRLQQAALVGIETSSQDARLVVVDRDRAGNILHLSAGGQRLDFEHDMLNRVTSISAADTEQKLRFEYDPAGCLVRQTGAGGVFQYEYDSRHGGCQLRRSKHDGVTYFQADYDTDDRLIRLTDPAGGAYTFSYETDRDGDVVRADVRDPEGTLRRISIDETGYWFSRWGSYRQ